MDGESRVADGRVRENVRGVACFSPYEDIFMYYLIYYVVRRCSEII